MSGHILQINAVRYIYKHMTDVHNTLVISHVYRVSQGGSIEIHTTRRITKTPALLDSYRTHMHHKGTPQCLSVGFSTPRLIQGQSTNFNVLRHVYLLLFIFIFP